MADYDIRYQWGDGQPALSLRIACADDREAKIMAHAMKAREHKSFEVWKDEALVYKRPHEAALHA